MADNNGESGTSVGISQEESPKGYDQVVNFLSEQLRSGLLKVGDRLLSERDLAVRLNISRPVVREALRSLAMIGVLEIQQGRGTYVRAPEFSALQQLFTFMFTQGAQGVDDIIELRQAIERQAIRLACARARRHDIEKLHDALKAIKQTINDPVAGGQADFDFHTRIVETSHSAALISIYKIVSNILRDNHIKRRHHIAMSGKLHQYIVEHHEEMLRAIQKRDVGECDRLLMLHFDIGEQIAIEVYDQE